MKFERLEFFGNQDLGVYISSSQDYAIVPRELEAKIKKVISNTLDVEVISSTVEDSSLLGSLVEMNSKGIIVSGMINDDEIEEISKTNLDLDFISGNMNASGNLVVSNNKKALVHPDLKKEDKQKIKNTLNVDIMSTSISGVKNVGAAAIINNNGALLHPKTSDKKIKKIEDFLEIPIEVGTVNYGSPLVGSGAVANDKGFIIGTRTTGHELGRIENTLFVEGEEE
ncbi:translation initiation factor IF-6 [archaeon SCG-AAA382B04]|nr:translation initiation factor IF-6 [archaeon SCG-AAA382B04]